MRLRTTLAPTSVTLLLLLAACGGGGGGGDGDGVASLGDSDDGDSTTETTLSEEEAEEAMVEWTECMREAGVDLPDFEMDGDGNTRIGIAVPGGGGGSGDDETDDGGEQPDMPSKEEFDSAQETCGDPPQLGGEFSEEDREEMQAQALAFAECMRDEGMEDFPDPDFSDMGPGAGPSVRIEGGGPADADSDGEERQGPFGDIDPTTPEFQAAADACSEKLGDGAPRFRTSPDGSSGVATVEARE